MSGFLTQRLIDVTFSIGTGTDGTGKPVVTKYSGLRVSANIVEAGGVNVPTGQFTIYGMTPDDMNKVSSLGLVYLRTRKNTITVEAGDAINGMSQVFQGIIGEAYVDFGGAPDAALQVTSFDGLIQTLQPVAPTSYNGSAPVASIMAILAAQIGYAFENNGVSSVLSNPYFSGTAKDQIQACAQAANINYQMRQGLLAIWPKSGNRGFPIPTVSPESGLIGYPTYASNGIVFRTVFNPAIIAGNQVKLQSSLPQAVGNWNVYQISHSLESNTPHGSWESEVYVLRPFINE